MSVLGEAIGVVVEGALELGVHLVDAAVDPVRKRYGRLAATLMVLAIIALPIGLIVLVVYLSG
ncbi:MAG: hypothetical protein WC729_05670 [Sphingomonas sp.]|jgi:hypothetical protein|uniref:hypothetical protein n=1 Tax=Sphingomonas sp. TaxID=28214 RepID=UPI003562EF6F